MTKPAILPKKVYLPHAITELDLDTMPVIRAINTILLYSKHDNLPIYFDDEVMGIDSNILIGEMTDDESGFTKSFVAEANQMALIRGKKIITRLHAYSTDEDTKFFLCIYVFSQNNISYSIPDEFGADLIDISIDYNKAYFDRKELLEFINEMDFKKQLIRDNQKTLLSGQTDDLPTYLDPDNEYYSEELALAIELHKVIYEDIYKPRVISLKQKIKIWLENNAPHLEYSEARNKRLRGILSIKKNKK